VKTQCPSPPEEATIRVCLASRDKALARHWLDLGLLSSPAVRNKFPSFTNYLVSDIFITTAQNKLRHPVIDSVNKP
jgi:hypothetical protein